MRLSGGKGEDIDVGGRLNSEGDLKFNKIDVGGRVKIDGNAQGKEIKVGGKLKVSGKLKIEGDIRVGGKVEVDENLNVDLIKVGGKIFAKRIEGKREIETTVLETLDGAKAPRIVINRGGKVRGPLMGEEIILKDKVKAEDIYADTVFLRKGCNVGKIFAREVSIESKTRVQRVYYTQSLLTDKLVKYAYPPEKVKEVPQSPIGG